MEGQDKYHALNKGVKGPGVSLKQTFTECIVGGSCNFQPQYCFDVNLSRFNTLCLVSLCPERRLDVLSDPSL